MLAPHLTARAAENGIELVLGGRELVDELEPLWLSLFDHHRDIGAAGLPVIERGQSWPRRRQLYLELLTHPESAVIVARRDTQPVGYCLVHVHHGADDTWPTGELIGEVESLAVVAAERGHGLGTLLLDAGEAHLAAQGAVDVIIGVLVGNDSSLEFYRRRGMTPAVLKLLRLGRPRVSAASAGSAGSAATQIQQALLVQLLAGGDRPRVGPFVVLLDETNDSPFRNYAAPVGATAPTAEEVAALTTLFCDEDRVPRLEYVEPQDQLTAALLASGYTVERRLPLLILGAGGLVDPPEVPRIEVGAAEDLVGAATVMGTAYGDPEPAEQGALRLQRTLAAGGRVTEARDSATGRIVGAGLHTAAANGLCEVAAIATDPDYRRRGIAALVSADLTRRAVADGLRPFLQAEGEPEARLYARLGYERCGSLVLANGPT